MMDFPKIGNGLPLMGPGTDIGISSLHMNYDSAKVPSDGYCPACREKGKLKALKTYRISFQESIFLCEDLQCIYPLGYKSPNNLISPDVEGCHTLSKPQKRKISEANCKDSLLLAKSKKTKSHAVLDGEKSLHSKHNEEASDEMSSFSLDLLHDSQQNSVRTADSLEPNEILEDDVNDMATEQNLTSADVAKTGGISSPCEGCTSELGVPLESTSFCRTPHVQWRNAYALCWLDCILSVLVHLEGLKSIVTDLCSEDSVFWRLFTKYNQTNKLLHTSQVNGVKGEYCKKLNKEIMAKIDTSLNEVRDEIFLRLQPQLRCTLGDMESPVFAFPLLLKTEPHIEKFFMYSYSWNFECSQCGHKYQNRCMKNLVTFTNVTPEWHPLNAAHFGPCNKCNNKRQIRKMILEKVSSMFMLHFVDGLPHNDLQCYSFEFEDCHYQVTSVIQYQANNHFITWVLDTDGSWLECDDLKGPCSERHEKFEVPASEVHIVIWERKIPQMIDKATVDLPLKKTNNDHHAFENEKQRSSPSCPVGDAASAETSPGPHPTNVSVAPNTLCQDDATACGDHMPSGPKGLVHDNILLLTFEDIANNSKGLPLENKPVAVNVEAVRTSTLKSQESQVTSAVSPPCKLKCTQDQFVNLIFPSQIVNTNMNVVQLNKEDTVITQPVNSSPATVSMQLVISHPATVPVQPMNSSPATVPMQPVISHHATVPMQPVISQPATDPVQPVNSGPATVPVQPVNSSPATVPMQPVISHPATVPVQPVNSSPATVPIQPVNSSPGTVPVQPVNSSPGTVPVQPVNSSPATVPVQPVNSSPAIVPVQPVISHPATVPVQPVISHPATVPMQPVNSSPATVPMQPVNSSPATVPMQPVNSSPATVPMQPVNSIPVTVPVQPVNSSPATVPMQLVISHPATIPIQPVNSIPVTVPVQPVNSIPATVPVQPVNSSPATVPIQPVISHPATVPVQPVNSSPATVSVQPVNSSPATVSMQPVNSSPATVPIQPVNSSPATVPVQPVNSSPVNVLTQGVKVSEAMSTVVFDKNAPLKQFLSPKTEKLKPEPVTSLLLNMKKKETAASSHITAAKPLQNPSLTENQKKPFVGSWVKGLLSRGASFMPPCVSALNRNTVTDWQPSVKGASNFGGFKSKRINQKGNRSTKKAHKCADKPPVTNSLPDNVTHPYTDNVELQVLKKSENVSHGSQLTHISYENGGFSANHEDTGESHIHKLRLKLLKKLKAKKKKLAALPSSSQNGMLPSENLESVSHCGSPNDCESIDDLLKELQYQIDNAGNKSGCTTVPGVSPDSSETHEQILAELLSPATVTSTELSENGEADVRYLEVGDNHIPVPVPSELSVIPQSTYLRQDHNYCSPTKKNQCEVQPDSLADNASVKTLNLESSMKMDIFDEFFSTSALNYLADGTLDLPHFDEYLFDS
ncbi:SUMO-specific isopeptidase USPL1 isoform X2 [Erinaceus europaeus]|uniref:SUMO-specific isopeptidase USPL1 isoform X2 n=2 Tax=Erinaceus europaeus TaxID=9365 RepID=A0ABM3XFP9_ERIEU|nr:SUMO-specific isopeptidase USPL1 isoform X2 [Erinaceus europaeus]